MTSDKKLSDKVEIEKEDLQLLLRPKLGKQVVVLKSSTSFLLPPGENFACEIYKVSALIKRDENEIEEELHFVVKVFPTADYIKTVFDFSSLFKKEIFFYETLVPVFKQIEIDFGVADDQAFNITPEIFGIRRSLNPNSKDIDQNVILLMENLKMNGYYMLDKVQGLDLDHSRVAIKALARFHALGIACKLHRPEIFKDVISHAAINPFQGTDFVKTFVSLFEMMFKDPRIAEHRDKLAKFMNHSNADTFFGYVAEEPWLSIAHCDFWTNNILYRKDNQGNLIDVKFIDFQNYSYNSPLKDLPYFLCSSTTHNVMTEHFDELLDLYHETFINKLKSMKINTEPYGKEAFREQLIIDANVEFFHNILAIKFFCAEIDKSTYEPSQLESAVIFSPINQTGYDKWYQIILTYIKQGWL